MKMKIKFILLSFAAIIAVNVFGQEKATWNHTIGLNLLQLPATTIGLSYELTNHPRFALVINPGFTLNYAKSFDFIGFVLSPHYKCGNDGYMIKQQSGGFLKIGMKFNFRGSMNKENYFYLGAFNTNAVVFEKAEFENWEIPDAPVEFLSHKLLIIGLTGAIGYNVRLSDRLKADFAVHLSVPSKNYRDLYGYTNYIPGMGFMETCGNGKLFPMVVLDFKYVLK
jgi:hypothetical protein